MKNLIIFISFIYTSQSFSNDNFNWGYSKVNIFKNKDGEIILKGGCNNVSLYVNKIRRWSFKLDNSISKSTRVEYKIEQVEKDRILCSVVLKSVLPTHLRDTLYTKSSTTVGGPNCWNGALFISKIIPYQRYSSEKEISFYMKSPLCKKVAQDEFPQTGDLVLNRSDGKVDKIIFGSSSESQERHGYIYITDSLIIEKAGHRNHNALNFAFPIDSHITYAKYPWFFLECKKTGDKRPSYCNYWADFYRCQGIDQYIEFHKSYLPATYHATREALIKIELDISNYHFSGDIKERKNTKIQKLKEIKQKLLRFSTKSENIPWILTKKSCHAYLSDKDCLKTINSNSFLKKELLIKSEILFQNALSALMRMINN